MQAFSKFCGALYLQRFYIWYLIWFSYNYLVNEQASLSKMQHKCIDYLSDKRRPRKNKFMGFFFYRTRAMSGRGNKMDWLQN